jgi:hypothetical protein
VGRANLGPALIFWEQLPTEWVIINSFWAKHPATYKLYCRFVSGESNVTASGTVKYTGYFPPAVKGRKVKRLVEAPVLKSSIHTKFPEALITSVTSTRVGLIGFGSSFAPTQLGVVPFFVVMLAFIP